MSKIDNCVRLLGRIIGLGSKAEKARIRRTLDLCRQPVLPLLHFSIIQLQNDHSY
jgi:hypothetical protein